MPATTRSASKTKQEVQKQKYESEREEKEDRITRDEWEFERIMELDGLERIDALKQREVKIRSRMMRAMDHVLMDMIYIRFKCEKELKQKEADRQTKEDEITWLDNTDKSVSEELKKEAACFKTEHYIAHGTDLYHRQEIMYLEKYMLRNDAEIEMHSEQCWEEIRWMEGLEAEMEAEQNILSHTQNES